MSVTTVPTWESKRTKETKSVERVLRSAGFERVDAYRYNSASIRVRVIDPRFEGMRPNARDALVEPHLESLPERTQADILTLLTLAPSEVELRSDAIIPQAYLRNAEFDAPSPSRL